MIRKRYSFVVAALATVVAARPTVAIDGGDLEPVEGIFSAMGEAEPYDEALRDALIAEHAYRVCQMLVIPSFEREWVVYIVDSRDGGEPKLYFKEMRQELWQQLVEAAEREPHEEWRGPESERRLLARIEKKVKRVDVPIARDLTRRLETVWFEMLARVRYPLDEGIVVRLDGVRYFAASWSEHGFRSGTTWSPTKGTRAHALVEIAEAMRAYALTRPARRPTFEKRIRSLTENLLAKLADAPRQP